MTPTEEEAEVAIMLLAVDQACDGGVLSDLPHYIGWATKYIRERGDHEGDCPLALNQGPVTCDRCVADEFLTKARAILAAGYIKRNDALEEAAKVVDGFAEEAEEDYEAASPSDVECVRSIRNRLWEVHARIRALKKK